MRGQVCALTVLAIAAIDEPRRAHRIGQIRDVHIYQFISQHTVEEAMLRKANQKRSLDDLVIQKGEFDWRSLLISRISTGSNSKKRKQLVDSCVTGLQTTLQIIKDASGIAGVPGLQAGLAGLLFVIDVIKVNCYCTLRCFLTGKQKTSQNARDIEQLAII
jgi:hypothetical protein